MKLSILGKHRKGKKSFELISEDEFGYQIECIDAAGVITYNNITKIEWLDSGRFIYMTPQPLESKTSYDFTRFDKVNIRKACGIAQEALVCRIGGN